MTHGLPQAAPNRSRLISLLSNLIAADIQIPHRQFAEKLALFINLADSIRLADGLYEVTKAKPEPCIDSPDAIRDAFLRERAGLVRIILKTKIDDAGGVDFKPLQKFYLLQQSTMESKIPQLRSRARKAVAAQSTRLAQLAELDLALDSALAAQSRVVFAAIPRLLHKRFIFLQQDAAAPWQESFCREMRTLLLAELEVRLQPVMGLIEALEEEPTHETNTTDQNSQNKVDCI